MGPKWVTGDGFTQGRDRMESWATQHHLLWMRQPLHMHTKLLGKQLKAVTLTHLLGLDPVWGEMERSVWKKDGVRFHQEGVSGFSSKRTEKKHPSLSKRNQNIISEKLRQWISLSFSPFEIVFIIKFLFHFQEVQVFWSFCCQISKILLFSS